ncbi:hypothetical protein T12_6425 [Trichinella patagoniensis]|uniref:Uncharacterized protein n=1 Tax=Trichinella patagoniensis TaxID=990121 RepID=A0A0V1A004_9BILA|nr:hypothetical protein T12_6425 [Trichinella patagoniensis]
MRDIRAFLNFQTSNSNLRRQCGLIFKRCLVIKMKLVFPQREMLFYVKQGYDEIFAKTECIS